MKGELLVDNKQISINNSKEWIKNIAYLSQRVYLFNSSIRNNITFASDDGKINEEKFNEIIKIVDLENMISAKEKKSF